MTNPPWEPPTNGTEQEHLVGALDRLRYTFRWKVDGLSVEQLRQTIGSSSLSLGGLLKHLACVEDDTFGWRMFGERPVSITSAPEGADLDGWMFTVQDDETAEQVYAMWDEAVARSRVTMAKIVAERRLDEPGNFEWEGVRPSIRRYVCDLVEEYGRHTGHADLIRESIDGRVGEDPPEDWRPGKG